MVFNFRIWAVNLILPLLPYHFSYANDIGPTNNCSANLPSQFYEIYPISTNKSTEAKLTRDSSVELELRLTNKSLNLITTIDSTVAPLINDGKSNKIPPFFRKYQKEFFPQYSNPLHILFEDLDPEMKIQLIDYNSAKKDRKKNEYVEIPELKTKDTLPIYFDRPRTLFGKTYPKGWNTVSLNSFFTKKIDHSSLADIGDIKTGIELHIRSNQSAGDNALDTWLFLSLLGMERRHLHVHLVANFSENKLRENEGVAYPALLIDFNRRTNTMTEMWHYYFYRAPIKDKYFISFPKIFGSFGFLKPKGLKIAARYFSNYGSQIKLENTLKNSYVALRGTDSYDNEQNEEGLYGQEFRIISKEHNPRHVYLLLNNIQQKMLKQEFGISEIKMSLWIFKMLELFPITYLGELISLTSPYQKWSVLFSRSSKGVKDQLDQGLAPALLKNKLRLYSNKNNQIKWLVHNWSFDPLLFDDINLLQKIERAQIHALKRVQKEISLPTKKNDYLLWKIIKEFLEESGLFAAQLKPFDISFEEPK